MAILVYLLGYLITGIIIIFIAAVIHLIRAEMKGYDALDYWVNHESESLGAGHLIGLMLWPERILNLIFNLIPYYYEQYNNKQ